MTAYQVAYDAYMAAKGERRPKEELRLLWKAVEDTYGAPKESDAPAERKPWDYSFVGKEVLRNRVTDAPGVDVDFSVVHHGPMGQDGRRQIWSDPPRIGGR